MCCVNKLLYISIAVLTLFSFSFGSSAQSLKNDEAISWDKLSEDASLKKFKRASKQKQIEILHNLLSEANEYFLKCKTKDDLYYLSDQLDLICFFNHQAKIKSADISEGIRTLYKKIRKADGPGTYNDVKIYIQSSSTERNR